MSQSFDVDPDDGAKPADDQIDLYDRATEQTVDDDILGSSNLGLGNYSENWLWMQVDSYSKSVFTNSAVAQPISRRVIDYALTQKAIEEWDKRTDRQRQKQWEELRTDEDREMDRRRWIQAKKADIWDVTDDEVGATQDRQELRREKRRELINEYGRGELAWQPPFMRMLKVRHEASRSLGARVLDNLFGRVSVQKMQDAARKGGGKLKDRFGPDDQREP